MVLFSYIPFHILINCDHASQGGLDMSGQLTPSQELERRCIRQRPDGVSPTSPAGLDSPHAEGHEAVSHALAGGGLTVDIAKRHGEVPRSQMASLRTEFMSRTRNMQEHNETRGSYPLTWCTWERTSGEP